MKKRVILILSAVALLGLAACAGGFFYLGTDHCQNMIQETINEKIPGSLAWEDLDVSIVRGNVTLGKVSVFSPEKEMIAGFDPFSASVDLPALFSRELVINQVLVKNPTARIRRDKNGNLNLAMAFAGEKKAAPEEVAKPSQKGLPFNIKLLDGTIENAQFSFVSQPDNLSTEFRNITIKASCDVMAKRAALSLKVGPGRITSPAMDAAVNSFSLRGRYQNNRIADIALGLGSDFVDISVTGDVDTLASRPGKRPGLNPRVNLTAAVNGSLGDIANTFLLDQDMAGEFKAEAQVKGRINDPSLSLGINTSRARLLDRQLRNLVLALSMEQRHCTVKTFAIDHEAGSVDLHGDVDLASAFPEGFLSPEKNVKKIKASLALAGKAIDLGRLLRQEEIPGVSGLVSIEAFLSGSLADPEASLVLTAENARYRDYPALDLAADLSFDDRSLYINTFDLGAVNSALTLSGSVELLDPSGRIADNPGMNLDLAWKEIDVNRFIDAVPLERELPFDKKTVRGDLAVKTAVRGSVNAPRADVAISGSNFVFQDNTLASLDLSGSVWGTLEKPLAKLEAVAKGLSVAGESADRLELSAAAEGNRVTVEGLRLIFSKDQRLALTGWVDQNRQFQAKLSSDGIDLSTIRRVKELELVQGKLTCSIDASGTFDDPLVQGEVALEQLEIMERPFEDFKAELQVKESAARMTGSLNFDLSAGFDLHSKMFEVDLDFDRTDLLPWLRIAGVKDIDGSVTGRVTASGSAEQPEKLSLNADINEIAVVFQETWPVTVNSLQARLNDRKLDVPEFEILLPGEGRVVLSGAGEVDSAIRAKARARIPATAAGLFVDTISGLEGYATVTADALVKKEVKRSNLSAKINLHSLGMAVPQSLQKLHDISGTITAQFDEDGEAIHIPGIHGMLDRGRFDVSGNVALASFQPEHFDFSLTGREIPVDMVEALELEFDTDLAFTGDLDNSLLEGTTAVSGLYTRDINLKKELFSAVTQKKQTRKEGKAGKKSSPFLETIALDLVIEEKGPFVVDNNMAYLEIHPDIRVGGSGADPVVSGRSMIDPGTIYYQDREFTLTRGIVDFTNPYEIEPELSIEAEYGIRDWTILLGLEGTPDALEFSLSSTPELQQADIVSLLLRGKTTNELIASEGGTTASPAAMVANVAAASVEEDIKAATGLDVFEVEMGENGGDSGIGDMNITVGKEVTENMTLKYSTEAKDGELVQKTAAEYEFFDNFSLSGFQDSQGKFGGEVRYRLEFR
ncbi:MAG TPA: translocation/assembly module TamB domain-containing protein [Desulfobacteraceae bacterium]|nr:translocation/assembly module TamB domain-containing protein [Desulfobacteraceae bacterium]